LYFFRLASLALDLVTRLSYLLSISITRIFFRLASLAFSYLSHIIIYFAIKNLFKIESNIFMFFFKPYRPIARGTLAYSLSEFKLKLGTQTPAQTKTINVMYFEGEVKQSDLCTGKESHTYNLCAITVGFKEQ